MFSGDDIADRDELVARISDPALAEDLAHIGVFIRRITQTDTATTALIQCDFGRSAVSPSLDEEQLAIAALQDEYEKKRQELLERYLNSGMQ